MLTHLVQARMYVTAINLSAINCNGDENPAFHTTSHLSAVYSPDPSNENYSFSTATPSGSLKVKKIGESDFEIGKFYRLLFRQVESGQEENPTDLICNTSDTGDWKGSDCLYVQLNDAAKGYSEFTELTLVVSNKEAWPFFVHGQRYVMAIMPVTATEA